MRTAQLERKTKETEIAMSLNIDGAGKAEIDSGVGFFDHMLELFAVHAGMDLSVSCKGDTQVDFHHSVEDIGIVLGEAFRSALGDRKGIARFADRLIPMDECAAQVAIDLGGRAYLSVDGDLSGSAGAFDLELIEEFFRAFCYHAGANVYIRLLRGGNKHHEAEAVFKAFAKCMQDGVKIVSDRIPSSKGVIV